MFNSAKDLRADIEAILEDLTDYDRRIRRLEDVDTAAKTVCDREWVFIEHLIQDFKDRHDFVPAVPEKVIPGEPAKWVPKTTNDLSCMPPKVGPLVVPPRKSPGTYRK